MELVQQPGGAGDVGWMEAALGKGCMGNCIVGRGLLELEPGPPVRIGDLERGLELRHCRHSV